MNAGYYLTRSAKFFGEKTAFVFDGQRKSYSDLNARVNKLANGLLGLGLKKRDRVGLLFHNSFEYVESYLALYKAGLVWVRLNARANDKELCKMLEDSQAKALIYGPQFKETGAILGSNLRWVVSRDRIDDLNYDNLIGASSSNEPVTDIDLEDISDIWYTSGTTGVPKGIMIIHRNIVTCTQLLLSDVYDIKAGDKFLTPGALSHAGSVRVLPFIARGATCYLHSRFDPVSVFNDIERERITDLALVPTMLVALMDHPERRNFDLSSLKRITYGGSPMPVERIKEAIDIFGPILSQAFGQAESIISITHLPKEEHIPNDDPKWEKRLSSTGREFPGVRVRVVNDEGQDLKPGQKGEIITRSDLVMKGYWNMPDKTSETIKNGWLYTGDIGYLDDDGYLYLVDRKNDKIISGGLNVFPREVEEVLSAHPSVGQVSVFGKEDQKWGEVITAAVVLRDGKEANEKELIEFCKKNLSSYKSPKHIYFVDDLPKNAYGKTQRHELKKQFKNGQNPIV
ncbi:AMP-binding protein [bacterium]|nr:AMP-binding protein [bacterium]